MIFNKKNNVFIVAEAGVNHNGNIKLAMKLIDEAVRAGADAIKFQSFKAENLASKKSKKANYQKYTTSGSETQFQMLKRLELNEKNFLQLRTYCNKKKIGFMTSVFDIESLDFVVNKLKVKKLKIPSGEITNAPLLYQTASSGLDIVLSTGMSSLKEIKAALSVIAFGYLNNEKKIEVSEENFIKAYNSKLGSKFLKEKVAILHCTTEYPTPIKDINLNAMLNISNKFNLTVGYSDHSEKYLVSVVAAAMGAKIIEKHFTLDKGLVGPDHKASLNPNELKEMVNAIREVEVIKGSNEKKAYISEKKNMEIARKVLVAKKNIRKGEKFNSENLTAKRAGKGISPMKYWGYLGRKAKKKYKEDQIIK